MRKRPFNKDAYDSMDKPSKLALVEMMKNKGYKIVGNIDDENFKKYDLKFKKGNKIVSFELEMRKPFETIKRFYDTIHIPIRKARNQSDFYIVWNLECDEFAMIETEKIRSFADTDIVMVDCNEGTDWNYTEQFIDTPKDEWTFYKKVDGKWVINKVETEVLNDEMAIAKLKELKKIKNNL